MFVMMEILLHKMEKPVMHEGKGRNVGVIFLNRQEGTESSGQVER